MRKFLGMYGLVSQLWNCALRTAENAEKSWIAHPYPAHATFAYATRFMQRSLPIETFRALCAAGQCFPMLRANERYPSKPKEQDFPKQFADQESITIRWALRTIVEDASISN